MVGSTVGDFLIAFAVLLGRENVGAAGGSLDLMDGRGIQIQLLVVEVELHILDAERSGV